MRARADQISTNKRPLVIAVDAMGADHGAGAVIGGIAKIVKKRQDVQFLVFGDHGQLAPLVKRKPLQDAIKIEHAIDTIASDEKPSHAMRHGTDSSMYHSVKAVKDGRADVALSGGNTGALMAISMLLLRRLPGVHRPAIAIIWPSRNKSGFSVMLDVGADIRADATDLLKYALMGASFVRNAYKIQRPRVGLLNVGTESHKGHPELQKADAQFGPAQEVGQFDYIGFVEGNDIPSDKVDLIVTDGFSGNLVLKSAEGTAAFVGDMLRSSFRATPMSRIAALFAMSSLRRLGKQIDPRRKNGGVFLGLNGTVVKSHGNADATGIAAALNLAIELAEMRFSEKLAARIAAAAQNVNLKGEKA